MSDLPEPNLTPTDFANTAPVTMVGQQAECLPPASTLVRAEKQAALRTGLEQWLWRMGGGLSRQWRSRIAPYRVIVDAVMKQEAEWRNVADDVLREQAQALRLPLRGDGFQLQHVARCFAVVREAADRTLGMRHFESQLLGGYVLLQGRIAEMPTGEGKTLTATLAVTTAALAGIPVHVISANDYLTARDCEAMRPLYEFFGLSVGCVNGEVATEQRAAEYACAITYCTSKDLVFDYLRDRMQLKHQGGAAAQQAAYLCRPPVPQTLLLRGLHFAILDEADSVLIDDARTPLVISGASDGMGEQLFIQQAWELIAHLEEQRHYQVDEQDKRIDLNDDGRLLIQEQSKNLGPLWVGRVRREDIVTKALSARHLFIRDRDYLVKDDKVQIIDANTGRLMPDRSWERGLHQLVELKEGCELYQQRETLAKISYQRFFRRYRYLAGMTGTAAEVQAELWDIYDLSVVPVPTQRPCLRKKLPIVVHLTEEEKWRAVVAATRAARERGQPVLIGTHSVAASEHLAEALQKEGVPCELLNARQDAEEADIIAAAGEVGRVTVATSMAGRGTDIKLNQDARDTGGLLVILTALYDARRIDRQLGDVVRARAIQGPFRKCSV